MKYTMTSLALLLILTGCSGESQNPGQNPPEKQVPETAQNESPQPNEPAKFEGTWEGNVYENGVASPVKIDLLLEDGKFTGSITITIEDKKERFDLLEIKTNENNMTFMIPIVEDQKSEWINASLEVRKDTLAGKFKEMKENKKAIPVSFKRRKEQ